MRRRLILEIGPHRLAGTIARGSSVLWHEESEMTSVGELATCVRALLNKAPSRRCRPRVIVALAFPFAQVKRLEGLPAVNRRRILTRIVRENAPAFFLRLSPALAIPEVHSDSDGAVWAAAYDRATIDIVASTARACRFAVERVVLADSSVPTALRDGGKSLSWYPEPSASRARFVRRAVIDAIGSAVVLAAGASVFAPAIRLHAWSRGASRQLERTAVARRDALQASAELARVTQSLAVASAFDAHRGAVTVVLGRIAASLPDSTAITSLRVDSMQVALVAVAPHVTEVLPALASLDVTGGPRLTGTVSREVIGGVHVERASFLIKRVKPRKVARSASAARAR